jgi:hypothetical protein
MRKHVISALSVSLLFATLAYAQTNKIDSFTPVNGENANADGMAILQYHPGQNESSVLIILTDFAPNTAYDFQLVSPTQGAVAAYDVLRSDEFGNVHLKFKFIGNFSDADVLIYNSNDTNFTEDELRAIGEQY